MNMTLKKSSLVTSLLSSFFAVYISSSVAATGHVEKAFSGKQELADTTLAGLRGSYVSANQILYFGVEMYTEWQTAAGDSYGASLNIGIDRGISGLRPTVTVVSNVQSTAGASGASRQTSHAQPTSGGLGQIQGVSQAVQTTGNGNGAANTIGIDIGTGRPASAVSTTSIIGGNRTLVDNRNGTVATTFVNQSGAGISISVPGQGSANQSIASMLGMQQRIQLYGDTNNVLNRLNLFIQMQTPASMSPAAGMNDILQNMRDL